MAEQLVLACTGVVPRCPVCWTPLATVPLTYTRQTMITEDCIRAACVRARRAALQALPRRRRASRAQD